MAQKVITADLHSCSVRALSALAARASQRVSSLKQPTPATSLQATSQRAMATAAVTQPAALQPKQKKMVLVVAVALIDQQQRVLLAQRPPGKAMAGLWEFPGGKAS